MKLKEKVKIIMDNKNKTVKEVRGITFEVKDIPLTFIVHESCDAWRENFCDISEKRTGLRLSYELKVPVEKMTLKIAEEEVKRYIREEHSLKEILKVVNNAKTI